MTRVPRKGIFSEKNPALRRRSILGFSRKDSDDFYKVMLDVLENDPSPVIRHEAIEALGDIGIKNKKISTLLKKLTKDKNPFIKDTAKIALATLQL